MANECSAEEADVAAAQEAIENHEERDGDLHDAEKKAQEKVDTIEAQMSGAQVDAEVAAEERDTALQEANDIDGQISALVDSVHEYQRGLDDVKRQKADLERQRDSASASDKDRLTNNIGMIDLSINAHETGISAMRSNVKDLEAEAKRVRDDVQRLSNEVHQHEERRQQLAGDLEYAQRELEIAHDRARHYHKELDRLNRELSRAEQAVQDCHQRLGGNRTLTP